MKVGSLFSGIGGIEIGFERQGFETAWFVENEPYAQAVLRKRFPRTKIYGDITELDFSTIQKVDILTGGFPCQDISNAGKRVGIEGSRSSLWKYYKEAIRTLRPKYALIENVAALASRGLNVVLADLAEIGYDAEWYNLSASAVGAPHKRERLFIIAYPSYSSSRRNNRKQCTESICKTTRNISNTNNSGCLERQAQEQSAEGREQTQCESKPSNTDVEDSKCNRTNARDRKKNNRRKEESKYSDKFECSGWWAVEPRICRVAHGVFNRVDRIKCLGNAVVPQVAEVFAQAIRIRKEDTS